MQNVVDDKSGTLVKICGMTRPEDARLALDLGADAVGMLFYPGSPRYVSAGQGGAIAAEVGDRGLKTGLFVNADEDFVRAVLAQVPLDILQFHGDESRAFCEGFGLPYWKTLRVKGPEDLQQRLEQYDSAAGILLDTWHPTKMGGTGEVFDWSVLDDLRPGRHLILAGGLNPDNVGLAITQVHPWAVDVCSGVEASPGIKSPLLMKQFIDEVRRV